MPGLRPEGLAGLDDQENWTRCLSEKRQKDRRWTTRRSSGELKTLRNCLKTRSIQPNRSAASSIESGSAKPDAIELGAAKVSAAAGTNRGTPSGASI